MVDLNFFDRCAPLSIEQIQHKIGGKLRAIDHGQKLIHDLSPIQDATKDDACFFQNRRYKKYLKDCHAGLILLSEEFTDDAPDSSNLLICDDPYRAWGILSEIFYPPEQRAAGVHPTAVIADGADIASTAYIGPYVVIEEGAVIGEYTQIHAGCFIGRSVRLGRYCVLHPHVYISHCHAGDKVIIHSGGRIGQDGFGFAMGKDGHQYVRQMGRVIIGSDVNIGANTTIDRGAGPDTIIEDGVRIDNLVQIAHNVHVGKGSVIVAQAGIAGSTILGRGVVLGGQSAVAGHLHLGDGAMLTAQSGTDKDIPQGEAWASSIPSVPVKQHWRRIALLNKLLKNKG